MSSDNRNRAEQRAARALAKEQGIKYTHALRLIREGQAAEKLVDNILREKNMGYNETPT